MILLGFFFVRNMTFHVEVLLEHGVGPVLCDTTRCKRDF